MNEDIKFLLDYAKEGVLITMKQLDEIEREELKREYVEIKQRLTSNQEVIVPGFPKNQNEEKPSAVKNWFSGIGKRQKAYQEQHKGELQ